MGHLGVPQYADNSYFTGGEEVRELRLITRISAAIGSLLALVLAGGAAWKC